MAILRSILFLALLSLTAFAQPSLPPSFDSAQVNEDRSITFRIHAPDATAVQLLAGDVPGDNDRKEMTKGDDGVWSVTIGRAPAGAFRYRFRVDGLEIADPQNRHACESNQRINSLVSVPGSDVFDVRNVPHGAVAEVTYWSETLGRPRRAHVYTPPGYEKDGASYPVLYLLHGASDTDDSWSAVGCAGRILDNLIADGKAKPMIVVMPNGHTGPFRFGRDRGDMNRQMLEFQEDFANDLRPHIEQTYRVKTDRSHQAIAGLSMGGAQTLNIAFTPESNFAYIGVFSSGVFGIAGGFGGEAPSTEWEDSRKQTLDDPEFKKGLELVWIGIGKDDFLLRTSQVTVEMLRKHNFDVPSKETAGGHTWLVWRDYLAELAPQLFADEN